MWTDGVVEGFKIGKYIVLCSCPCRVVLEVDQLAFEAAEEVLCNGVVIRIAAAGHALPDAVGFQTLPIGPGGILDAPVAVKSQTFGRFAAVIRHIQGCQRQLGIDLVREGITGNPTRTQIFDDGEIEPTFPGGNIGNVSHPGLVRPVKGKVPLQKVVRNGVAVIRVGCPSVSSSTCRGDPSQPHLPVYPFAGAAKFRLQQTVQTVQPQDRILLRAARSGDAGWPGFAACACRSSLLSSCNIRCGIPPKPGMPAPLRFPDT